MTKILSILLLSIGVATNCAASTESPSTYTTDNEAYVSFDVSMPIDSTGYLLKGHNLTGGDIQYKDKGSYISPLLGYETGAFQAPVVRNGQMRPLIKTTIDYSAIKFINPNGINNLFIKVGMGKRTQKVSDLDPTVLKDGIYTWQASIFSHGIEHDTVDNKTSNVQFMQVGSIDAGPHQNNMMYTQDFYVYSRGAGNTRIPGQPIKTERKEEVLPDSYQSNFLCHAEGMWGAGGDGAPRTLVGACSGSSTTMPAGPNLDYEYGSFTLPTVKTPWNAMPDDTCLLPDHILQHGCVNATIESSFRYMAKKIRVPISSNLTLFAEFGTAYRNLRVHDLRYECTANVYLRNIVDQSDCLKKSYLSGGASYPYFAVGYEVKAGNGTQYSARYINIPGQENGNRLAWIDASNTQIYAITSSVDKTPLPDVGENLNWALQSMQAEPDIYRVLGANFFIPILKKNNILGLSLSAIDQH